MKRYSDKELLAHLSAIMEKYGYHIGKATHDKLPERLASEKTYRKRFGSWRTAKEMAYGGLLPQAKPKDKLLPKPSLQTEYSTNKGTITSISGRVKTLDEALKKADVDLDEWDVERYIVNSWEVGANLPSGAVVVEPLWQVKVWLKKKISDPFNLAMREVVRQAPVLPRVRLPKLPKNGDIAAELAPFDMHFGKFAWNPETLGGNMDLKIAKGVFVDSCEDNLEKLSRWPLSKIFFVMGNDLMHFENIWATTPMGGHQLDVDSRLPKVIEVAMESIFHVVDLAVQIAPVEIIRIAGNHDLHASYWMGKIMEQRYRDNKHVLVDNGPCDRKCRLWGDLLVAWTHDASGRKQMATVNMLPQFFPKEWGESRFREWHVGHKHKAEVTKTKPVVSLGGTIIRQLSCLSTIDRWHFDNVFVDAIPACESFIWDKKRGIRAMYPSFIDYQELGES